MKTKPEPCPHCHGTGCTPDHAAIGGSMRARRLTAGLSLCTVAKRLGLSVPFISDLERGRRNWSEARINQFKEATTK